METRDNLEIIYWGVIEGMFIFFLIPLASKRLPRAMLAKQLRQKKASHISIYVRSARAKQE